MVVDADEFEIEFLPGLAAFVLEEIDDLFRGRAVATRVASAWCRVAFTDPAVDPRRLLDLRTAVAVHLLASFDVPRPKALLGDEAFTRLVGLLRRAMALSGAAFESFRINAAGRDSAVFERLTAEIARATGLAADTRFGDLLVRVRRSASGWDVSARTTPRPLATRSWRTHNYRGALNATIAAAMVRSVLGAGGGAPHVNVMCGSGTLLAELHAVEPGATAIGLDNDASILNLAAEHAPRASYVRGDARHTPFPTASCAALTADLPYGQAVGAHEDNDALYRAVLAEAARIGRVDARFAVITHDIRRFRRALDEQSAWIVEGESQVFQKGHNPVLWLLRRVS